MGKRIGKRLSIDAAELDSMLRLEAGWVWERPQHMLVHPNGQDIRYYTRVGDAVLVRDDRNAYRLK
jgi:hypothetical protein